MFLEKEREVYLLFSAVYSDPKETIQMQQV